MNSIDNIGYRKSAYLIPQHCKCNANDERAQIVPTPVRAAWQRTGTAPCANHSTLQGNHRHAGFVTCLI